MPPFLKKLKRRLQAYRRLRVGRKGEDQACKFLRSQGFFIWKRNWRCRFGELDIIAYNDRVLRFIEVKTRIGDSSISFPALEAIDAVKTKRLESLAYSFVRRNRKSMRIRRLNSIAVDAITVVRQGSFLDETQITHIQNIWGDFNFN